MKHIFTFILSVLLLAAAALKAEEPDLPAGLEEQSEPDLPAGLDSSAGSAESGITAGTLEPAAVEFSFSGFLEGRYGRRLHSDPLQKDESIGEGRAQFELDTEWEQLSSTVVTDFVYDPVLDDYTQDFESGSGVLDLREANFLYRAGDYADIKLGRQILTWGTGDLVFINDLFPKDWNSFFIGRDEEYLKAPSDAVKFSLFNSLLNLDIVYTAAFDADRYIDGRRVSFFDPSVNGMIAFKQGLPVDRRASWFSEDELALRLYRQFGSYEAALYYYNGYWKSPAGSQNGLATFPALSVYGGSLRGPLSGGILSLEGGYYDSRDDIAGRDPLVRNSEYRFLIGYEHELFRNFTAAFQFYHEGMRHFKRYRDSFPAGSGLRPQDRSLITVRLTYLLFNQNLRLSLFNFYSPQEKDGYLRLNSNYKVSDNWRVEAGANIFYGQDRSSFFGQFKDAANVYIALRWSFEH
ncbi:MAG: hypothetical protein D6719_13575 [Candidatus Dadabacteria bacterium]|nr:MAG: hypothetical protein D6719_13575 [Candidatus Dadabacteria bacterium]